MFRRILVPLDGSRRAEAAVSVAAQVAHASGGTLVFVDVANVALEYGPMFGPVPLPQDVIDRAYDETVAYLKSIVARADLAGIATETEVLSGPVADVLLGAASAHRVDLIVMNSHGRGGIARWALGSVADHLVHHAPVPILVLREPEGADAQPVGVPAALRRALVALDGSPLAEAALAPAADLIRALAAPDAGEVHLARVIAPAPAADDEVAPLLGGPEELRRAHEAMRRDAEAYLQTMAERPQATTAGAVTPRVTWEVIEARDVASALMQAAEETSSAAGRSATVVALATHGRGGIARWALGSVAERVLVGSHLPALIVRPAQVAAQQGLAGGESPAGESPKRTAPLFPPGRHARPT